MGSLTAGDWIAIVAAGVALMTAVRGYAISPPFVARSEVIRLARLNEECEDRCKRLDERVAQLEAQVSLLRGSEAFWQEEWRKLRQRGLP